MKNARDKRTAAETVSQTVSAMNGEFHAQSDRVVAIVGAAYLDSALDALLRAAFIDSPDDQENLLGPSGALSSNGVRSRLAYCLGLVTKDQRHDLVLIAKIRNKFAHDVNVTTFDAPQVRDFCASLKAPAFIAATSGKLAAVDVDEPLTEFLAERTSTPREQFRMSVSLLLVSLLRRVLYVQRERHQWFSNDPDAWTGSPTP